MSVETEAGYEPAIVFGYLTQFATVRDDGRYLTFAGKLLEDTHRDTFDRWFARETGEPWPRIPLDRWDEILCNYGVALWEFEDWAEHHYGRNGFLGSVIP